MSLRRTWLLGLLLGAIPACNRIEPAHSAAVGEADRAAPTADKPTKRGALSFVEDDFDAAMAEAAGDQKLVFVDAWAPWCHTCLSMRDVVFTRPELTRFESSFVFAAVDTDRETSAGFLERYRLRVWPTFFVLDPATGGVLAMHGGSMSLEETSALLDAAKRAHAGGTEPGEKELVAAHAAYRAKQLTDAAALYQDAAVRLPDAKRAPALMGAIRSLAEGGEHRACVQFGTEHADHVPGSSAPSDFLYYLKDCADKLADKDEKASARQFVQTRLRSLVDAPRPGQSIDDRTDTMALLAEMLRDDGDTEGARVLETKRLSILEAAAAQAPDAEQAQTFDYARMNAYLALGRGDDAVKMFQERIRQLPESYEAHARLGSTLLEMGRAKEAVAPLDRAIALSYGPRRLRYMAQKSKAQLAAGERPAAIATLEGEVAGWLELPVAQRDEKKLEDARARLLAARK